MRTYPIASNGKPAGAFAKKAMPGFTLIEVLVSLTIVVLVTGLTAPLFGPAIDSYRVKSAAHEVSNGLKRARQYAILNSEEAVFSINTREFLYQIAGEKHPLDLPSDASLSLETASSEITGPETGAIRFFNDGSATGGRISISYQQRRYEISVDWLTGHIALQ